MNTVYQRCPACGRSERLIEVSEEQSAAFEEQVLRGSLTRNQWRIHVYVCPHCDTPQMVVWPFSTVKTEVLTAMTAADLYVKPQEERGEE